MTEPEKILRNKIEKYGFEIDQITMSRKYDKFQSLLDEMEQFAESEEYVKNDAAFNYYLGTGYGTYSDYLMSSGKLLTDTEVIEMRRLSMLYFRKGIALYDSAVHTDSRAKLRILTNYANGLDTVGRVLEALRIYREVLHLNSHFSIALGNYGRALQFLANMVNDSGHCRELYCYSYQAIKKAVSIEDPDLHEQAITAFQNLIDEYEKSSIKEFLAEPIVYEEYTLGDTEEEVSYRKWCLTNHLFLNPLNEVMEAETAFAHDPLTITTFTEDNRSNDSVSRNPVEPPRWFAMLNQLKEEYVYARYLYFAGSEMYIHVHFADEKVQLSQASFDYANYSIRIEQLKSSFRILYLMIDQICFFINDFWNLGIGEKQADAYHLYKAKNYPKDNVALISLYWILCEFFEKYGEEEKPSEKSLGILRNALEHKYVKIHQYKWNGALKLESDSFYHLSEEDLKKYTMRLLEISREAMMYLVYAIGIEESKKEKSKNKISLYVTDYPDEWKH